MIDGMASRFIRVLSIIGLIALLASIGIITGTLLVQTPFGPADGQPVWPSEALRLSLLHTLWMAAIATFAATLIALPAAIGMSIANSRGRAALTALTTLPLFTMPSVYAYATLMITTSKVDAIRGVVEWLGWNNPNFTPLHAGLVQAWWLWPIPALLLAAAYRHVGAPAYRLALLDANPIRAFLRGAMPPMRDALIAAAAAVFVLSAIDSTVPPFMAAARVWGVELMADAAEASSASRPAAYLFYRAWPLVAIVMLLAAVVAPSVRRMANWDDASTGLDTGRDRKLGRKSFAFAALFTAALSTSPIWIYAITMFDGRYGIGESFASAWQSCHRAFESSIVVALATALLSIAAAVALLDDPSWSRASRGVRRAAAVLSACIALLPPALVATTVIAFFSKRWISPPDRWNLYDNTPTAWIAAMVCRYAFIPIFVARIANRRIPGELPGQAATDGANRWQTLVYARLPHLWRPLIAAGILVAGLAMTEVAASSLLQPSQWGGGSIAVWTDGQMHFGRHNHTTALGLMMMSPGVAVVAVMLGLGLRRGGPLRSTTRIPDSAR